MGFSIRSYRKTQTKLFSQPNISRAALKNRQRTKKYMGYLWSFILAFVCWLKGPFNSSSEEDGLFKINFYWSIVALQSCVSFCCTQSESAMCSHICPLSWIAFPFRSLQIELNSRSSLVICFMHSVNSVYMSVPVSQFIPLPLSLLGVHMFVLYLCFCFANKIIYTILLDST